MITPEPGFGFVRVSPGVLYLAPGSSRTFSLSMKEELYRECSSFGLSMSRICLHDNQDSPLHAMVILVLDKFLYPPHKHSWKHEGYFILEGECEFQTYQEDPTLSFNQKLSAGDVFLNDMDAYHSLIPKSNPLLYTEYTKGPFSEGLIQYL